MSTLQNKEIVLGVTGGIACYKSLEIVRGIRENGGRVTVIMTKAAMEFVQPLTFQTLSERPVAKSMFSLDEDNNIGHIKIVEKADAFLIAPSTANNIAKAAHGFADDYLTTALLACPSQVFYAPAMNHHMWDNPATQENLQILERRGAIIIPPESGYLACGSYGAGRMAEPTTIVAALERWLGKSEEKKRGKGKLNGVNILVTAGPTQESIDPARFLTNHSSGKMGYAIAKRCRQLGGTVCLISGPSPIKPPDGIEVIQVKSTEEMRQEVMKRSEQSQLIVKAAAVSDYRIDQPSPHKLKKKDTLTLKLVKNPDILKELGDRKREDQFLVGFAAESENLLNNAQQKLSDKNLDLIVANNILEKGSGFNVDTNKVFLIDHENQTELPMLSKEEVAARLIDYVLSSKKWEKIQQVNRR